MNVQEFAPPLAESQEVMLSNAGDSALIDQRWFASQAKSGCSNTFGELHERHRLTTYHSVLRMPGNHKDKQDDDGLSEFLSTRAHLLGIAYRILKSTADAEDLVQDVWIRWQTTDRSTVRDAAAFLVTMTKRLAINVVRSARSRRETSFELLVQESVDACPDPRLEAEQSEKLRRAIVVLLEKLSATERAAYVLREAFDYSYREIANTLRLEEANARQLVTRARQHLADGRLSSVNSAEPRSFLAAFLAAAQKGALATLESVLVRSMNGTVRILRERFWAHKQGAWAKKRRMFRCKNWQMQKLVAGSQVCSIAVELEESQRGSSGRKTRFPCNRGDLQDIEPKI